MKQTKKTPSTRGFTLLEVLIAVLIVGIIATAAVPLLSDYAERARDARMAANVQALDRAVQRYELDHQAPWGFVYEPLSEDGYIPYNWEGGLGFVEQLEQPTDAYGNVLGDPGSSVTGPCVHGPYVSDAFAPAALLLGASEDPFFARQEGGNLAIVGKRPKDKTCDVDPVKGVPLAGHDFVLYGGAPKHGHEKGTIRKAIFIIHDLIYPKAAEFLPKGDREALSAAYKKQTQSKIGKFMQFQRPRPDVDMTEFEDVVKDLSERIGLGNPDEKQIIVEAFQELVSTLGANHQLSNHMRSTVAAELRGDDVAQRNLLVSLMQRLVVDGVVPMNVADDMQGWLAAFGHDGTKWRREYDALNDQPGTPPLSPRQEAERMQRRAGKFWDNITDDGQHENAGIDQIVLPLVQLDLHDPDRVTNQREQDLQLARRTLHVHKTFDGYRDEILAAAQKGDKALVSQIFGGYAAKLVRNPRISIIGMDIANASADELPRVLFQHGDELRGMHVVAIGQDYNRLLGSGEFRNIDHHKHTLGRVIGIGEDRAAPPGGQISQYAAKHGAKFLVGYVVRAGKRVIQCEVETFMDVINTDTARAASIERALRKKASSPS